MTESATVPIDEAEEINRADRKRRRDAQLGPALKSSGEFVRDFSPPEFIWDGILQRGYLYSFTAVTGAGKTAVALLIAARFAQRQSICGRETVGGRVVYLAGENADDVRMRWLGMAEKLNFDASAVDVHFIDGTFNLSERGDYVAEQIAEIGGCTLLIVDTSPAFFEGGDENSNVELIAHAKTQRRFTRCSGRPAVLSLCHPTKNASGENLLPRGGGGFLAEVDGNLVAKNTDLTIEFHWQGKLRGPGFEPVFFELAPTTAECLKDTRGRSIMTVIARDLSRQEAEHRLGNVARLEDQVILALDGMAEPSIAAIAIQLNWIGATGEPQKSRVHNLLKRLVADDLVSKDRRNQYKLTVKGEKEALKLTKIGAETAERCSNAVDVER